MRSVLALAAVVLGVLAPTATAATTLNVIPHGQWEPGVSWGTAPGMLPAPTQAQMYDRLTPLFRDVTDAQLVPSTDGSGYYKSAALLPENDPSFIFTENVAGTAPGVGGVSARIKRDNYGVPHIYSDTDAGAIFGAGYVVAEDRNLLLDQARFNAVAGLIDMPGVPAIQLVLGLYNYKPSSTVVNQATTLQTKAILAQGTQGRQLLSDIDVYLAGINLWYSQNRPSTPKFTRTDIYALNALKSQFLGQGGGEEVANAQMLDGLRSKLGSTKGNEAYEDLRGRDDPETATTTTQELPLADRRQRLQAEGHGAPRQRQLRLVGAQAAGRHARRPGAGSERRPSLRAAPAGQQHPHRQRQGLADRLAAVRRRAADRLQLPGPHARDGAREPQHPRARRHVGAVPRLHADRPRPGLRVDADLGRERPHRHLRRTAVRRVEGQVPLQGQVPDDGEGRRRHDLQGRQKRQGRASGAPSTGP